jgi:unsaturated rhamnogalacturonyl hydrolase
MRGADITSSRLAAPPLPPLPAAAINSHRLLPLGRAVVDCTWRLGLPSWFWGEGVALSGIVRLSHALGEPVPAEVHEWIGRWLRGGVEVDHVNNLAPGIAAVLASPAQPDYLDLVEPLARWAESAPLATRAANGALEHWPGDVWADTPFMAGVFLGHLGATRGNASRLDECGRQLVAHADILQSSQHGLFAHGCHRGETIPCYWGRANAWCALAAVEYLELAKSTALADPATVERVETVLRRQLIALADRQPDHGVWSVLVDDPPECAGIVETSAAAGIGAAMLRSARVVPDIPRTVADAGWLAVRGALAYVDDGGALTRVSAGTVLQLIPFGYSVIRDDRPQLWGQGLALHAIAAAVESGAS